MAKLARNMLHGELQVATSLVLILIGHVLSELDTPAQSAQPFRPEVTLSGTAAGGVVSLALVRQACPRFVSIQTTQGESAESVLRRLAEEVERSDPFGWHGDRTFRVIASPPNRRPDVHVAGDVLTLLGGSYAWSGTDPGFGIPEPAKSVSGSYDPEKQQIVMSWVNPQGDYDEIHVSGLVLPPGTTNCAFDRRGRAAEDFFYKWHGVLVKHGKLIGPPASINVSSNSQEELDAFPFYMGVAPNWSAWSGSDKPEDVQLAQGVKS